MHGISTLSFALVEKFSTFNWQFLIRLAVLAAIFVFSYQYFISHDFNGDEPRQTRLKKMAQMLESSYDNHGQTVMAINGETVTNRVDDDVGLFVLAATANLVKTKVTGSPIYPENNNVWKIQIIPYFLLLIGLALTIKSFPLFVIGASALAIGVQDVSITYLMNNRLAPAVAFIVSISLALDFCVSRMRSLLAENLIMGFSGLALGLFSYVRADSFYIVVPIILLAAGYKFYETTIVKTSYKTILLPLVSFFIAYFFISTLAFTGLINFLEYHDGVEHFAATVGHSAWHPLLMGFGVGTTPNYENICWIDSCGYTLAGQIDPQILSFEQYEPVAEVLFRDLLANNPWLFFNSIAHKFEYYINAHQQAYAVFVASLSFFLATTLPFSNNPRFYITLIPLISFFITLAPGVGGTPVAAATAPAVAATYILIVSIPLLGFSLYFLMLNLCNLSIKRSVQCIGILCAGFGVYQSANLTNYVTKSMSSIHTEQLKKALVTSRAEKIRKIHAANFAKAYNDLDSANRAAVLNKLKKTKLPIAIVENEGVVSNFKLLHAEKISDAVCIFIDWTESPLSGDLLRKQPYDIMIFRPEGPDHPYAGLLRFFNNTIQIDPSLSGNNVTLCHRVHGSDDTIKLTNIKRLSKDKNHFHYLRRFKPVENDYIYTVRHLN